MFNRHILMSFLSIVMALAVMTGGTLAFFTDTASSTGNTFSTGNADLQIAADVEGAEAFSNSITGPNFSGIVPGEIKEFTFWLKNNSSGTINLDLTADVSAITPSSDVEQTIDNALLVSWVCDLSGDGNLADETPTSKFSPREWLTGGNAGLGSLTPSEQMICRMFGELPSSADNTLAGQSVSFDAVYNATQVTPTPTPIP
jgi:spore coat-associated protein N